MASLTQKQVTDWNKKLSNGFKFDTMYFLTWNEKEVQKYIELPSGKLLRAKFEFQKVPGATPWERTGLVRPVLELSVWTKGSVDGIITNSGGSVYVNISEQTYTRKNYNVLASLTAEWDDKRILETARKHMM